jgi:hypothetical protein
MWSAVCSPLLQEHIGLSRILYLCKYDLILPWPVTIVVKFSVTFTFNFNLSAILGKNDFVTTPLVVRSYSLCHFCYTVIFSFPPHCTFRNPCVALVGFSAGCRLFRNLVRQIVPVVCVCVYKHQAC